MAAAAGAAVAGSSRHAAIETRLEQCTRLDGYGDKKTGSSGSIEVGKRADLVILDRNLFEIPASEISDATVVETIFDGRTVYKRTSN